MKNLAHAAVLFACCLATPAAANIDCQRDRRPIEQLICSDAELIMLDNQMSSLYYWLKNFSSLPGAQLLLDNQREWLRVRDQCWNTGCLRSTYIERINAFQSVINGN